MAEVSAFHGLRYDEAKAGPLSDLICPPYDVISEQLRDELYQRSPYNLVRVEYGREEGSDAKSDRYFRAKKHLEEWVEKRVLRYDLTRAFYLSDHYFEVAGQRVRRRGFYAALRLYQEGRGIVRPHEKTFPKHKADRLELLRATRTNTSPVFGMVADKGGELARTLERFMAHGPARMVADTHVGNERHLLWLLDEQAAVKKLAALVRDERVYIADGHHRYETGLNYQREEQEAKHIEFEEDTPNFILTYLCTLDDPGLRIFPTHRIVRGARDAIDAAIERSFIAEPVQREALDLTRDGLVHVRGGGLRSLRVRPEAVGALPEVWRSLPVAHGDLILGPARDAGAEVSYEHDLEKALDAGRDADVLLVAPVSAQELRAVADAWQKLPEKTTYFYPKVPAGLVMRPLGD